MGQPAKDLVKNSLGRYVPEKVNGERVILYQGVANYRPGGTKYGPPIRSCADYPSNGDKRIISLREALEKAGINDGMTISTHHCFGDGDLLASQLFDAIHQLGVKDLVWFPSASFPCHEHLIRYLEDGTIDHIEGGMNGPLGKFTSEGGMQGTGVIRSHGGRYQAVQDSEVNIDIAVIGASCADSFGNANGLYGPSAGGLLGSALADAQYADKVIVVTDHMVEFPCTPWQIQGNYVDYTVEMERIGIPERIISGTTRIARSPERLLLAEITTEFCYATGIMRDGFSFQTGVGGISPFIANFFAGKMREKGIKSRFACGGSNKYLVNMLEEGLVKYLLNDQPFDQEGLRSMRDNPNHLWASPFASYNYHGKGNFAGLVDVAILEATEVDVNFNANVVSHSDGYLLHGIGEWQDCLLSKTVILSVPLFRDRIPLVTEEVTTVCGPGELIDVVVTERGIAINPRRTDLIEKAKKSRLPVKSIEALREEAEKICGKPARRELGDELVAVVKWVDGTVMDAVKKVAL
ncbi:MAG: citrate lyase subunit alpha [Bacteroidota bacterium]